MEKFQVGSMTVQIVSDDNAPNPREEFDNLSSMVCFHNRYALGDKDHGYRSQDFNGWNELKEQIIKDHVPILIMPLFMFDHSGLTLATNPDQFRAWDSQGWDWGQIGWVFVSAKKAQQEEGSDFEACLNGEVEEYWHFLSGEVYGYRVEDEEGEIIDSCYGFYGLEECKKEAISSAEHHSNLALV